MQFVILLIFSLSLQAKTDFCSFNSDFADKYLEARKKYANHIKDYRETHPHSKNKSGSIRAKESGSGWPQVSLKKFVNKFYKTSDIEIKVKGNGKMLIYPKKIREGNPVIVFDPSGDYFRLAKAKVSNGMVIDEMSYFDLNGKPLSEPNKQDRAKFEAYAKQTHFQAIP